MTLAGTLKKLTYIFFAIAERHYCSFHSMLYRRYIRSGYFLCQQYRPLNQIFFLKSSCFLTIIEIDSYVLLRFQIVLFSLSPQKINCSLVMKVAPNTRWIIYFKLKTFYFTSTHEISIPIFLPTFDFGVVIFCCTIIPSMWTRG